MNNPPLRTVRFYGKLGSKFGRVHRLALDTNTPAEAMRALCAMHPGLQSELMGSRDKGVGYAVFRGKENIGKDQLGEPVGNDDIRIAPIIMGSKNGGVFQIILGVVLVVVGGIITGWSFGAASPFGTAIAGMGVSMILGGAIQLLSPVPKAPKGRDAPDNAPSYTFSGAVNTQAQGNPVPLLYGRMIVGSAVVSAGLNAEDYSPATTGVVGGYNSKDYDIDDDVFGWNPKTPYDDPPEAL